MISAARNIIPRNPAVEKVLILDRTPRFDPQSVDPSNLKPKLSEYGNLVLREEHNKSDVKDKIVICSHSLPDVFQQNLFGHPESNGFDGIHYAGVDGANHYTRSVCNILQKFINKDSRELHNHTIPRSVHSSQPTWTFSTTSKHSPAAPPPLAKPPTKPDSVVVDIESPTVTEPQFFYSVPTYNPFTLLGN